MRLLVFLFACLLPAQERTTVDIETYFSPNPAGQAPIREAWVREIDKASASVSIVLYSYTLNDIRDALLRAKERGVEVRVIADNTALTTATNAPNCNAVSLARGGIAVKQYIPNDSRNIAHHKFMILDDSTVATGSANWTVSAVQFNHENMVILRQATEEKPKYILEFRRQFESMWNDEYASYNGTFKDWTPSETACR